MFGRLSSLLALGLIASPALGQDTPTIDFNEALDHSRVTGGMVRQAQQRERRTGQRTRATPGQMAACAKKRSFRDQFGANDAKVKRLYSLCRGVGL